jgi:putative flippase GtrA
MPESDPSRRMSDGSSSSAGLTLRRSIMFSAVGVLGIGLQLGILWVLAGQFSWHYLAATIVATETAVLHNFVWHTRWTWADRPASALGTLARLLRFHVTNGVVSIAGSAVVMTVLTGYLRIHFLPANMASILVCAVVNLWLSDTVVFRREWRSCGSLETWFVEDAGCPRRS